MIILHKIYKISEKKTHRARTIYKREISKISEFLENLEFLEVLE